ncbi:DUF1345 domain-containing protein [Leucobacter sp. CSA2]|uniref:DUF1345 domain-containing protein n=1 Tax=Leucobacter edaphi TaxID=2796472 RepID=A0A934UXY4_9MICO|nr:DUF1345 domain-containing protein [Leucobacter edaphi]MBK0421833.1 DUF1345 domain-containing protein [Leucobacter edaphi]
MLSRRTPRDIPLRFDDGFRTVIATITSIPFLALALLGIRLDRGFEITSPELIFAGVCGSFAVFFIVYLVWTHRIFSRTPAEELKLIAATQSRQRPSGYARALGVQSAESFAMMAAFAALAVAIAAAIVGARSGGIWLTALVLLTVGLAWATVAYAFALRYLRLNAVGETIEFDIREDPGFPEFLSMGIMVSAIGAMSAGTPRTSASLTAVRVHTSLSFAFNALIIAMTVSLIATLVAGAAA